MEHSSHFNKHTSDIPVNGESNPPPSATSVSNFDEAAFRIWKWKVLRVRRDFFIMFLTSFSLFLWLCLAIPLIRRKEQNTSVAGVILTFSLVNAVYLLALILTSRGKILLRTNSLALRGAILLGLSVYPLLYCIKTLSEQGTALSMQSGVMAGSFITVVWLSSLHHIGFSDRMVWLAAWSLVLMWGIFFTSKMLEAVNYVSYVSGIVCCLEIAFCHTLQEAEYRELYKIQCEEDVIKLNDVNFTRDIAAALNELINPDLQNDPQELQSYKQHYYERQGLLDVVSKSLDSEKGNATLSFTSGRALALENAPYLSHAKHICESLFFAATSGYESAKRDRRDEVFCDDLCADVFHTVQGYLNRKCCLYYDHKSAKLLINARRNLLRLVLVLLAEDSMIATASSICQFSFENQNQNLHITIRRVSVESYKDIGGSAASIASENTNSDLNSDPGELTPNQSQTFSSSQIADPVSLEELMLPERRKVETVYNSARFRLANRIARKHLKTRVEVSETDVIDGLSECRIRLVIPGPVSIVSLKNQSTHSEPGLSPWYIVEYHKGSDDKLKDIKEKLDVLGIPWKPVHAYHLSEMRDKSQMAVVHYAWFKEHKSSVFKEVCFKRHYAVGGN